MYGNFGRVLHITWYVIDLLQVRLETSTFYLAPPLQKWSQMHIQRCSVHYCAYNYKHMRFSLPSFLILWYFFASTNI